MPRGFGLAPIETAQFEQSVSTASQELRREILFETSHAPEPAIGPGTETMLEDGALVFGAGRSFNEIPLVRPISRLLISLCLFFLSPALFQSTAIAQCANAANGPEETMGCWSDTLSGWPHITVHSSLLPDGRHLAWGRVEQSAADNATIWDPTYPWDYSTGADNSGAFTAASFPASDYNTSGSTNPPVIDALNSNYDVNLFCGGHTFLPDGPLRLPGP